MTISSTDNRKAYTGDGTTSDFSFPYYFLEEVDLLVYKDTALQTLTTDYTIAGEGNPAGGTVQFNSAPANGTSVVIIRDPDPTQELDLVENDPLPAESLEEKLDKAYMVLQRQRDLIDRVLKLADSSTSTADLELPDPEASHFFRWNSAADGLENVEISDLGAAVIGVDVQAWDALLDAIAALTTSADKLAYFDGSDSVALTDLTSVARQLLDDASFAAMRTTLGLAIGSDVQAYDADTALTDTAQSFTAPQRGQAINDNDGNFDMDAGQHFNCTPTGDITLQFTNVTAGQSGIINLDNSGGHAISIDTATILAEDTAATDLSETGEYAISYHVPNGETKARIGYTGALS